MPLRFASGIDARPAYDGYLISARIDEPLSFAEFPLGSVDELDRWSALYRPDPYWMKLRAGYDLTDVPIETQHLLIREKDGTYVIVVPLVTQFFRSSLKGSPDGLVLLCESGSDDMEASEFDLAFVMEGEDPYELRQAAAEGVAELIGIDRLRHEKPLPAFVDRLGWCTWDAFYQEVSHEKVRAGLESFKKGGVQPGFVILDDGWQTVNDGPTVHQSQLISLAPNEKFGGNLTPTVNMAKQEYGVTAFLVWHAMQGYWAGVEMPNYGTETLPCELSTNFAATNPDFVKWIPEVQAVTPFDIHRFFNDYHRTLRYQGVDGVKVDNQAALETIGEPYGGRVSMMRFYREALEGSTSVHFAGNLMNCMSCSNDMLFQARTSNLVRTSGDFYPEKPETHGEHLVTNAYVGFGFGEYIQPDWDMFQSGHPEGAFHAAGRAISGGPVYVSDKPGSHDFALLKKIATPDGWIPRALQVGIPTEDCLMHDPATEPVPLKVFNRNRESAVIGLFNCGREEPLKAKLKTSDVPDFKEGRFVVHLHTSGELFEADETEEKEISLAPLGWEVATIAPLDEDGIAVIGLANMLNPGGAVHSVESLPGFLLVETLGGGDLLIYSERRPREVMIDGEKKRADYSRRRLLIPVPPGAHEVEVIYL